MTENQYLTCVSDNRYFIKLIGELRYTSCGPLETYIQMRIMMNENLKSVEIDLTRTDFLDSTHLGILASLAVFQLEQCQTKSRFICLPGDILTILTSSGFEEIAEIATKEAEAGEQKLEEIQEDSADLKKTMLKAHTTLASMNEQNKKEYMPVVEALKR